MIEGIALGLAASAAWGSADFCARFSGRALGSATALFGVMASGAAVLTLWLVLAGPGLPPLERWSWSAAGYGVFSLVGMLCLYDALRRGPVTTVVPLAGAFPAWSLLIAIVLEGFRPQFLSVAAMAIVMMGMVVVVRAAPDAETKEGAAKDRWCIPVALLAGLFFGGSLEAGRHASADLGNLEAVWAARLLGAVMLTPLLWRERRGQSAVAPRWWGLVTVQGVLDTSAFLVLLLVSADQAAAATVVSSTFGLITMALAWTFLGERLSRPQWSGVALVFAGIVLLSVI